jgi:hypothetical protein
MPALAPGVLGVMSFGKMPACLKDGRGLRDNFIIGGCFPIIAGNAAVYGSSLSFTEETAAGPLAVRRLERRNVTHCQSSGEEVSLYVSRGRSTIKHDVRRKSGRAEYAPLRRNGGFWVYPNRTPH